MSSSHRYESVLKCAVSLVGALLGIFLISLSGFSQASQIEALESAYLEAIEKWWASARG